MKESIKKSFTNSKFKNGAYSTIVSVAVIILVLIVNLIAGQMNLKVDVSEKKMFTLTKETKDMIKSIKDDITLYYMAGDSSEDTLIKQLVEQYKGIGSNVKVVKKDPIIYPKFASQYSDSEVSANSVIVVNHSLNRSKVVNYYDMLVTEVDYQTYSSNVTGVDVEGKITSAIQYVTADNLPIMYTVEGHGEMPLNEYVNSDLEKGNITTKSLQTLTAASIPKDCSILLINGSQYDFTKEEAKLITDYLKAGGKAIIFASYTLEEMPNFDNILYEYGITLEEGIVAEGNESYSMPNNPAFMVPSIESHEITSAIIDKKLPVIVPLSKGIRTNENLSEEVKVTPLLGTSEKAYSKVNANSSSYEKEEGDINGPFYLGAAITSGNEDTETKIALYGSSYILDESMMYSQFANTELLLSSIQWMSDTTETLSIPTKEFVNNFLTINAAQLKIWSIIIIGVIPMSILGIGIAVTIKRRKQG